MRRNIPGALAAVGGLGNESKMPHGVLSWGFSRQHCVRGRELARKMDTICRVCYGATGNFRFANVQAAQQRRLDAYEADPEEWAGNMAYLIRHMSPDYFRWFSVGDLRDELMLAVIADVARSTRKTRHWLPTHEPHVVADFGVKRLPANLVVRLSADYIEDRPTYNPGLPTHTVHRWPGEPVPAATGKRKHSLECPAYQRGNNCGSCRACWEPRVANTSFLYHGPGAPKKQRKPTRQERQDDALRHFLR